MPIELMIIAAVIFAVLFTANIWTTLLTDIFTGFHILRKAPLALFRYLFWNPILVFLVILSFFLSPFLSALSMVMGVNVLPWPLNLFHTHDDTLDGGQRQRMKWPVVTGIKLWQQRMAWICRNPAYGFLRVAGLQYDRREIVYEKKIVSATNPDRYLSIMIYDTYFGDKKQGRYFTIQSQGSFIKYWTGWRDIPSGTNTTYIYKNTFGRSG